MERMHARLPSQVDTSRRAKSRHSEELGFDLGELLQLDRSGTMFLASQAGGCGLVRFVTRSMHVPTAACACEAQIRAHSLTPAAPFKTRTALGAPCPILTLLHPSF